jgi:ParB family chromosome partitioning protein
MWFAREMKRMHDAGFQFIKIASIVGKSQTYVSDYIQLVEKGENRLIGGVEHGLFSMSFAVQVAQSEDSTIQNVLMDAFDGGLVNCNTVTRVRKLLELRLNLGKSPRRKRSRAEAEAYTIKDLTQEITKITKDKKNFVRETTQKENRLLSLLMGTSVLLADAELLALLKSHDLNTPPQLAGQYAVELNRKSQQPSDQAKQEARQ